MSKPKPVTTATPEQLPMQVNLYELKQARMQRRVEAFLALQVIYEEIDELDIESEALNNGLTESSNPTRAAFYQARMKAVCERERVLLPQLRVAAVAFRAADLAAIAAGAERAEQWGVVKEHEEEAKLKKQEPSKWTEEKRHELDNDPLTKADFDYGLMNENVEQYVKKLSDAYPELA